MLYVFWATGGRIWAYLGSLDYTYCYTCFGRRGAYLGVFEVSRVGANGTTREAAHPKSSDTDPEHVLLLCKTYHMS